MGLPNRPSDIRELRERIASGALRESRALEFKRELPKNNKALAKQLAGLAAHGGVLVVGVAETKSGLQIWPIDCEGARERAEQIARDIPQPPVQVTSYILDSDTPGSGVLWIEIPASPDLAHEVEGTYYTRDDTQTRPMRDSEVADRMALRRDRPRLIVEVLNEALEREKNRLHHRCTVAPAWSLAQSGRPATSSIGRRAHTMPGTTSRTGCNRRGDSLRPYRIDTGARSVTASRTVRGTSIHSSCWPRIATSNSKKAVRSVTCRTASTGWMATMAASTRAPPSVRAKKRLP